MTLEFRIGYIDFALFERLVEKHQDAGKYYQPAKAINQANMKGDMRAHFGFSGRMNKLWNTPEFRAKYPELPLELSYFNCHLMLPGDITINSTRAYDLDPINAEDLTRAESMTRKQDWAIWRFMRDNVPVFKHSQIVDTGT